MMAQVAYQPNFFKTYSNAWYSGVSGKLSNIMVKVALSKIAMGGTNFVVSKMIKKPHSNRLSRVNIA